VGVSKAREFVKAIIMILFRLHIDDENI